MTGGSIPAGDGLLTTLTGTFDDFSACITDLVLSVDGEGSELNVLKNFDFKKYKPKVVVLEFLDLTLDKLEIKNINLKNILNSNIYNLLISNDYNLVNILHADLVFIHNEFKD